MIIVKKVFCCIPIRRGNVLLGTFGAVFYNTLMVLLFFLYKDIPLVYLWKYVASFVMVLSGIHMINCILLIIGTTSRSKLWINPWLFTQILIIISSIVIPLVVLLTRSVPYLELIISGVVAWLGFQIYFYICVYSMYVKNKRYISVHV